MVYEVIFDLETKTFFDETGRTDPSELGVSIVSLYRRKLNEDLSETEGEIISFWEDEIEKMWKVFEGSDRIIGFNSKKFDLPALKPYAPGHFFKLPHFDILEEIKKVHGHRMSLNKLAKDTLGKQKTDSGANAIGYWKKKDKESLEKLKKYCEADVLITKEIYDFVLKNKFLKYKDVWNNPRTIVIDFSYPEEKEDQKEQIGLF